MSLLSWFPFIPIPIPYPWRPQPQPFGGIHFSQGDILLLVVLLLVGLVLAGRKS